MNNYLPITTFVYVAVSVSAAFGVDLTRLSGEHSLPKRILDEEPMPKASTLRSADKPWLVPAWGTRKPATHKIALPATPLKLSMNKHQAGTQKSWHELKASYDTLPPKNTSKAVNGDSDMPRTPIEKLRPSSMKFSAVAPFAKRVSPQLRSDTHKLLKLDMPVKK